MKTNRTSLSIWQVNQLRQVRWVFYELELERCLEKRNSAPKTEQDAEGQEGVWGWCLGSRDALLCGSTDGFLTSRSDWHRPLGGTCHTELLTQRLHLISFSSQHHTRHLRAASINSVLGCEVAGRAGLTGNNSS